MVTACARCWKGWRPSAIGRQGTTEGAIYRGDRATAFVGDIWHEKIRGCSYRDAARPTQFRSAPIAAKLPLMVVAIPAEGRCQARARVSLPRGYGPYPWPYTVQRRRGSEYPLALHPAEAARLQPKT